MFQPDDLLVSIFCSEAMCQSEYFPTRSFTISTNSQKLIFPRMLSDHNDIPTPRTFVGVSIIIGAGIYIYLREKTKDQLIVTDTPTR